MKRIVITIYILSSIIIVNGWSYPVQKIYPENCAITKQSSCAYSIPIIEDANYQKFRYDPNIRKVYSMLQGTTYFDGRDLGIGSHQGIDIASAEGTPISATTTGKIIIAEYKGGRGRVITIEHQREGHKIYSSYAHLKKILVSKNQIVSEGEIIAIMGSSGNSTGPHLHFQIEKEGEHPFFFKNCPGTTSEIVNEGRCQSQMYQQTIDPILFIEKNGNIPIERESTENNTININKNNNFKFTGFIGGILNLNENKEIIINPEIQDTQIIDEIRIEDISKKINIFPNTLDVLNGDRNIFLTAKKKGFTNIHIQQKYKTREFPIFVQETKYTTTNIPTIQIKLTPDTYILIIKIKDIPNRNTNKKNNITIMTNIYDNISPAREKDTSLKSRVKKTSQYKKIISQQQDNLHPQFLIYKVQRENKNTNFFFLFQNNTPIGKIEVE